MASSRPKTTLIPSPTRPRRLSATNSDIPSNRSNASSSTKFLQPNPTERPRGRPVSLPASSNQKFPTSPSSKSSTRPFSHDTPSRLPRPSIQTPRRRHRPSTSVEVSPSKPKTKQRASVLAPLSPVKTQPLHIDVPAPSLLPYHQTTPRQFSKRDPQYILKELYSLVDDLDAAKIRDYLPLDVMLAVHERELMEGDARLQRAKSIKGYSDGQATMVSSSVGPMGVFGFPLRHIALYASTKAVLGGFEHDLPIVVFACVEELYRSGISTPSNPTPTSPSPNKFTRRTLSSSPLDPNPIHPRLSVLLAIFDSPERQFGLLASLKDEVSDDIYALLTTFLSRLPEPVIAPLEILQGFRNALWMWCVKPHPGSNGATSTSMRIRIAQMLLGLLPTPNLSLFVYLMAFSCQVLEVRMKRRRRESAARDSLACGSGEISVLEAQLLALERELEGKNEREKEKRRLGRAWGVWLFGKDDYSERRHSGECGEDFEREEDSRSTQMMAWFVSNWGGIIRGFFEGGISVDPDTVVTCENPSRSANRGTTAVGSPHGLHLQQPMPLTESLFASSASLNRLRGDGVSPNATPKQAPLSSPLRIGLVREQSYGKTTDVLIASEIAQEGSIHSRYSTGGISDENESKKMVKEGSQGSVSALDERLLGLDIPQDVPLVQSSPGVTPPGSDAASCRFQLRDETTDDLLSESISTSTITSAFAYAKPPSNIVQVASEESDLAVLEYRRPLRVVNRSDSDSDLSSGSDSELSVYSLHSGKECDSGDMPKMVVFAPESEPDVTTGLPVQDDVFSRNHYEGLPNSFGMSGALKKCCQCAGDCPVHVYTRELEIRVEALVKENDRLRLGGA